MWIVGAGSRRSSGYLVTANKPSGWQRPRRPRLQECSSWWVVPKEWLKKNSSHKKKFLRVEIDSKQEKGVFSSSWKKCTCDVQCSILLRPLKSARCWKNFCLKRRNNPGSQEVSGLWSTKKVSKKCFLWKCDMFNWKNDHFLGNKNLTCAVESFEPMPMIQRLIRTTEAVPFRRTPLLRLSGVSTDSRRKERKFSAQWSWVSNFR